VEYLLRRLHNAHYQAQGYADDVVLLQKGKFVTTLCDRMQGALNCVENWCRELSTQTRQKWSCSRITERLGVFIILDFLVLNEDDRSGEISGSNLG
jgi:hypothetical protein